MTTQAKWVVTNPATGQPIGELEETPIQSVPQLLSNARKAQSGWASLTLQERICYFRKLRLYMVDHLEELVKTIAEDTGKVPLEALTADVMVVLDMVHFIEKHAVQALSPHKTKTPLFLFGKKSYVEYKPRGVVLVISPWNFPFQLAMVPVLSALIGGNCVILKPSEVTPMVGKLIEHLFEKAGFPPDTVQVAHGGKELGAELVQAKPDYIFFTGSVRTGRIIQMEAAKQLIPTTLELGGKDPMIVFADAPLDRAVQGAVWGAFTNSGQVCMSVERLYVERPIYDRFVKLLSEAVHSLRQGFSENHDIGSMTFQGQLDVVKAHVEEALQRGAKLETGAAPEEWNTEKGLFLKPMVLTNVEQDMKIVQEETFGPLLPVLPFDSEEEAIQLANDSAYGLNASVWSTDLKRAKQVASRLITGNVLINDVMITVANPYLPFGGAKESGIGRYHAESGLQQFCHQTSVMVDRGTRVRELNWFPYEGKLPLFYQLIRAYFAKRRSWLQFIRAYRELLKK